MGIFLENLRILSDFLAFFAIFFKIFPKFHKIGGFGCKKSSKFAGNLVTNIHSWMPKIDHSVALCVHAFAFGLPLTQIIKVLLESSYRSRCTLGQKSEKSSMKSHQFVDSNFQKNCSKGLILTVFNTFQPILSLK